MQMAREKVRNDTGCKAGHTAANGAPYRTEHFLFPIKRHGHIRLLNELNRPNLQQGIVSERMADNAQLHTMSIALHFLNTFRGALMSRFFGILVCTAFASSVYALDIINTVAGNGANSNHADNVPATSSVVVFVGDEAGLTVDASGNIFICDVQKIRRIDAITGIITTVAGTGTAGFSGDGGPATSATLNQPADVCFDSSGNLYIADRKNNRVRKVTMSTGIITTVAGNGGGACNNSQFAGDGGPATSALLNNPKGVCVDSPGNIYIADSDNNCVRQVAAGTGIITTFAGKGFNPGNSGDGGAATSATLGTPNSVAVDSTGAVYIADSGNARVRVVSSGMIFNYAGSPTGTSGYSGDGALATAALVGNHLRVATDSSNNVYIADGSNSVVRMVNFSSSYISTIAGTGARGFSGDGGPATSAVFNGDRMAVAAGPGASPDIVIFDQGNVRIRKIHLGTINTVAGMGFGAFADGSGAAASFSLPTGMFVDQAGNILVCDQNNNRVRRIDAVTGAVSTIAGTGVAGFSGDGGPAVNAQLTRPQSVKGDSNGNIFIADTKNHCVRKIDPSGNISTFAGKGGMGGFSGDGGPATSATISEPDAVELDAKGDVYIIDGSDQIIRKVDPSGIISTVAGTPGMNGFSGDGGPSSSALFCSLNGGFFEPVSQMAYIIDGARIRKIDIVNNGLITTVAGNGISGYTGDGGPATSASLIGPLGVSATPNGDIFIADPFTNAIRKVDGTTGIINTIVGTGVPGFSGDGGPDFSAQLFLPTAVLPAPGGLYILDTGNNRVRRTSLAPASGGAGVTNIAQGEPSVSNPEDGLSISVLSSNGGVIQLLIDVSQLRNALDVETEFDGIGTRSGLSQGLMPVNQFVNPGVFVANVTATDLVAGTAKKGRKTLVVGGAEVGLPPNISAPPSSGKLKNPKLKGKFAFSSVSKNIVSPLAGSGGDSVTLSASFEMPAGFDTSSKQEVDIGIGNLLDVVMIDSKGRGTVPGTGQLVKKLQVKYPKLSGGSKTSAGQTATITITMSGANFSSNGFDTEGITNQLTTQEKAQKSLPRSIQVGMVIGGVAYDVSAPVSFKLSSKGDTGTMGTRTGP
jgi:sugar lactone lactonase YvrE